MQERFTRRQQNFSSFCYLSWMFFYVICFQFQITCHACEYVLTNGISVRTFILLLSLQITPGNKCSGLSAWWLQPQFSSEVCVGVYGLTHSLIASESCTLYKIYNLPFVPVHFSCSWLQWNSSVIQTMDQSLKTYNNDTQMNALKVLVTIIDALRHFYTE